MSVPSAIDRLERMLMADDEHPCIKILPDGRIVELTEAEKAEQRAAIPTRPLTFGKALGGEY